MHSTSSFLYLLRALIVLALWCVLGIILAIVKATEYAPGTGLQELSSADTVTVVTVNMTMNPRYWNRDDPAKSAIKGSPKAGKPVVKTIPKVAYNAPTLPKEFWGENNPKFYFDYPLNEPDKCGTKQVDIIMVILSAPSHAEKRDKLRHNFAKRHLYRGYAFESVFLLALTNVTKHQDRLSHESKKYHDIIQANFTDSYHNLSYKTLSGLTWARKFCPQAQFVYKVDDDAKSAHRSRLVQHIQLRKQDRQKPLKREILCFYSGFTNPAPHRDAKNKWNVRKEDYPEHFYPLLCLGSGGYVLTMDVVQDIIDTSHRTKFFWLEDVYITGILRTLAGHISITAVPKQKGTKQDAPAHADSSVEKDDTKPKNQAIKPGRIFSLHRNVTV